MNSGNVCSPTPPAEDDGLLARCPRCNYRLRGLPVVRPCPECGLAIDRRWRVFGGRSQARGRFHLGLYLIVQTALLTALSIGLLYFLPTPPRERVLVTAILVGALIVAVMVTRYRPSRFIALGPDGLIVFRGRHPTEIFRWQDVGRAHHDLLRKSLALEHRGDIVRIKVFRYFGTDPARVDDCVRAINAYPRPARSSGAGAFPGTPAAPPGPPPTSAGPRSPGR